MKKSELKEIIKAELKAMDIVKKGLREASTQKIDFYFQDGRNLSKIIGNFKPNYQAKCIVDMFRGLGTTSGNIRSFLEYLKKYIGELEIERDNERLSLKMFPELKQYFTTLANNGRAVKDIYFAGSSPDRAKIIIDFNEDIFKSFSLNIKKEKIKEIEDIIKKYRKGKIEITYSPKNLLMTIS